MSELGTIQQHEAESTAKRKRQLAAEIKQLLDQRKVLKADEFWQEFEEFRNGGASRREKEAYQRGWNEAEAWTVFKQRLSSARRKYPDFEQAWASLRSLQSMIVEEVESLNGSLDSLDESLDAAYLLSKDVRLREEIERMDSVRARQRFRDFVRDVRFSANYLKTIREVR